MYDTVLNLAKHANFKWIMIQNENFAKVKYVIVKHIHYGSHGSVFFFGFIRYNDGSYYNGLLECFASIYRWEIIKVLNQNMDISRS